jgi:hypothetical protein
MAISRQRHALGGPGLINTIMKTRYRLSAERIE